MILRTLVLLTASGHSRLKLGISQIRFVKLNIFIILNHAIWNNVFQENKIKDSLELHYQFLVIVSEAYLEEKITCFAMEKYGNSDLKNFASILKTKTEAESLAFLDELIEESSHTVFFTDKTLDKINSDKNDDLQNMGDYFVTLWYLFKTLEFITKSGDPNGIQYFKHNSILLTLALHSTSSKYLHKGFQELIKVKSMSDRMRLSFNIGHFVKYHGSKSTDGKVRFSDLNNRSEDMGELSAKFC